MRNKLKKKFAQRTLKENSIRFLGMLLQSINKKTNNSNYKIEEEKNLSSTLSNFMENESYGIFAKKYKKKHNLDDFVWFSRSLDFQLCFIKNANKIKKQLNDIKFINCNKE